MPDETIVAVYDTAAHAEAAVKSLLAANVPPNSISQHASSTTGTAGGTAGGTTAMPVQDRGFWSSLFGGEPDHDASVFGRSIEGGSTVVTVKAPAQYVTSVSEILEQHSPIDLDQRASSYGLTQTAPQATAPARAPVSTAATAPTDGGVIQLSEEQLVVGKRLVNRGTTRVRRFVVEVPVEEQVTLHSESVKVERRPVTDGRTVADSAFTDRTIEMTETAEQAVVGKSAHVYEEVGLRKDATDRVETVKDTVRREDVKIEQVPGADVTTDRTATTTTPRAPKI